MLIIGLLIWQLTCLIISYVTDSTNVNYYAKAGVFGLCIWIYQKTRLRKTGNSQ